MQLQGKARFACIAQPLNPWTHGALLSVRSPALLALALALLASSGALAYVLEHDAVGAAADLQAAQPGQTVTAKGTLAPFAPRATSAREAAAWADVERHFANGTAVQLDNGDASTVLLVTTPHPAAPHGEAVVTGTVVLRVPHPDGSGRTVLLVASQDLAAPILFG